MQLFLNGGNMKERFYLYVYLLKKCNFKSIKTTSSIVVQPMGPLNLVNLDFGIMLSLNANNFLVGSDQGQARLIIVFMWIGEPIKKDDNLQRRGDIQAMLEDVSSLVPSFEKIIFSFCYRECNEIAHRLAKWATSSFSDEVWLVGGPSWISDLIVSDSPNLIY